MARPVVVFPDAQLVVTGLCRSLLESSDDPLAASAEVGTKTPKGLKQDPKRPPYVLVRLDGTASNYPVAEDATVRITVWHQSEAKALGLAQLLRALLMSVEGTPQLRTIQTLTGPVPTGDPESGDPLATFTVRAALRPSTI